MRKTDLARLLARRPDGIFVSDAQRGEIGPIYSELPALWALKACSPNAATGHSVWPAEAPDKGEEPEASGDEPGDGSVRVTTEMEAGQHIARPHLASSRCFIFGSRAEMLLSELVRASASTD
jgi:hypothetical protein